MLELPGLALRLQGKTKTMTWIIWISRHFYARKPTDGNPFRGCWSKPLAEIRKKLCSIDIVLIFFNSSRVIQGRRSKPVAYVQLGYLRPVIQQRTLKNIIRATGVGLHTGKKIFHYTSPCACGYRRHVQARRPGPTPGNKSQP